jgi:hypothetical protein
MLLLVPHVGSDLLVQGGFDVVLVVWCACGTPGLPAGWALCRCVLASLVFNGSHDLYERGEVAASLR